MQECTDFLSNVVRLKFPWNIEGAFAYGSAVFPQLSQPSGKKNMIDFILVVEDPREFHKLNLHHNYNDYSFMRFFGPSLISSIGNKLSAGVYYNPFIKCRDKVIKYGVVTRNKLLEDLLEWRYLYIAGRLHKPVAWLTDKRKLLGMEEGMKSNLKSAIRTALILLPETFEEKRLYEMICSLSYVGDIRTFFGIDSNKSSRIVTPNFQKFQEIYTPLFKDFSNICYNSFNGIIDQDRSPIRMKSIVSQLPFSLRNSALHRIRLYGKQQATLYGDPKMLGIITKQSIKSIVLRSSTYQTFTSTLSSGVFRTTNYVKEKFSKAFQTP